MTLSPLAPRLARLLQKYRQLVQLAARRDEAVELRLSGFPPEETLARRRAFRSLASEFPGALRELQALSLATLQERLRSVEAELAEATFDPGRRLPSRRLVALVLDYHETLAAALAVKLWLARRLPRGGEVTAALELQLAAARASGELPGLVVTSLDGHLRPEGGRLQLAVVAAVAARHGLAPHAVEAALFGGEGADPREEA